MDEAPKWVDVVLDALEGCVECYSPGSLDVRFVPVESQLVVAPALAEIVGGAEDGEEVYPLFSAHLAELAKTFDGMPEMSWDTMYDELHVEGEIDGEDAWITIQKFPFSDDDETRWVIEEGTLRRRKDNQ
jgi:hypothetical protein